MSVAVITPQGSQRARRVLSHPMTTVAIGLFLMVTILIVATVAH